MKKDEPQPTRETNTPKPLLNKIDYSNRPVIRGQSPFHKEATAWSKQGRDIVDFFMDLIGWFIS